MIKYPVMLVDDDISVLSVYKKILKLKGFDVFTAKDSFEALKLIDERNFAVIISDIIMPKMNGMQLLKRIKEKNRNTEVIMLTAEGSISGAVEAVKLGAFSYQVKPVDIDELIACIRKAKELYLLKEENDNLKQQMEDYTEGPVFIGESASAKKVKEVALAIAETESTVLISGESGTGKEIIANMIHNNSGRKNHPFISVNCAALNDNLIESELFGAEKGSYTGADRMRKGRFELANSGTLFFDEIGELSMSMQVKLLRVLQERKFERVGGTETIYSDFRLISATNRNLKEEIEKGNFRDDLYYRLNIIPINVPPLRERKEDIPLLCEYYLSLCGKELKKQMNPFDKKIMDALVRYSWPGNARELRNIIERMVVMSYGGNANFDDLPDEIKISNSDEQAENELRIATKAFEKKYIIKAMEKNDWNVAKAAEELGIARKNLYRKFNEYNINYKK